MPILGLPHASLVAAILGPLVFAAASPAQTTTTEQSAAGKRPALSAPEQEFLRRIARVNLGEVAVGLLAIQKGTHDAVKAHGRDMVDGHVETMKELMELASRHNLFLPLEVDRSAYEKLVAVGGAEFDRLYAAEAQRLNQEAIDHLNGLMGQLTSEAVRDFARRDLEEDKEHLKEAQDLAAKLTKV